MLLDDILQPFDVFYISNNVDRIAYFVANELWFVLIIIYNTFIHDNAFTYNIGNNGKPNELLFVQKYIEGAPKEGIKNQ